MILMSLTSLSDPNRQGARLRPPLGFPSSEPSQFAARLLTGQHMGRLGGNTAGHSGPVHEGVPLPPYDPE